MSICAFLELRNVQCSNYNTVQTIKNANFEHFKNVRYAKMSKMFKVSDSHIYKNVEGMFPHVSYMF